MAAAMTAAQAAAIHTLTDLISTPPSSQPGPSSTSKTPKVYPNDDTITALLAARSRAELPYTRLSPSGTDYVVVNPLRMLEGLNDASRLKYQHDVESTLRSTDDPQPSVYELAGRVWLLMSRRKESQGVVYHGLTGSGKSTASQHFTTQVLRLSAQTKNQRHLADQITYLLTVLESFGNSKTPLNPSASQHGRFLELHFSSQGIISGAKVLAFGLNKSRIGRLSHEERTFHVFYQLLAGASPEERDALNLEGPSDYALLANSGCYRLPGGPFSDDSAQLGELRAAFASLGFKAKHVRSIFTVLTAILLLSNITFTDNRGAGSLGMSSLDEPAMVEDRQVVAQAAAQLGVNPAQLENVLINKTKWVRKEICSMILDATGAAQQRDNLMRDMYAILFIFVIEMANKRLCPPNNAAPELQIVQLDLPGYQSRTMQSEHPTRPTSFMSMHTLVNAAGQNGFDEFCTNFTNEMVHSYLLARTFEDELSSNRAAVADGVRLPSVITMDNAACVELIRGGLVGSQRLAGAPGGILRQINDSTEMLKGEDNNDDKAEHLLEQLSTSFGRHASYTTNPGAGLGPQPAERHAFGINHYSGQCSYDVTNFVDRNSDVLDKQLVDLLRSSSDSFISKLVSGPGLATEGHPLDPNITVEAQVTSIPLRAPTEIINPLVNTEPTGREAEFPVDSSMPQPVVTQLNGVLSTMLQTFDQTRLWTVNCIRPNDNGHPNSFDKRRVKAQVKSLVLADRINRRQVDYIADYSLGEFCTRHGLEAGQPFQAVEAHAESMGWIHGQDYHVGRNRLWLSWNAWKEQEDSIRSAEHRQSSEEMAESEDEEVLRPPATRFQDVSRDMSSDSTDNLLVRRQDSTGVALAPNTSTDNFSGYGGVDERGAWGREDKEAKGPSQTYADGGLTDKDGEGLVVHEKRTATEVVATTPARRWWLRLVWLLTWWIPSFLLRTVGKMKRADVRLAWREKLAIFMMVIGTCGLILFYIIVFGMLLCPDSKKAWNPTELARHTGTNDYYAAIAGNVYDFTDFYKSQHSDLQSYTTSTDVMLEFAGLDLTKYFPRPMISACPNLVTSDQLSLQRANFTPIVSYAVHTSGALQTISNTKLDASDWYTARFMPKIAEYYKGTLVYDKAYLTDQADNSQRYWAVYKNKVYDLSDYVETVSYYSSSSGTDLPNYDFFNSDLTDAFKTKSGQDITKDLDKVFASMNSSAVSDTMTCLDNAFYVGKTDFRLTARCTVQNYLLLAFSVLLMTTMASKFFAALQLNGKRYPELLDKFVICQVPCYTEGEESLKRTIDSLANLNYDDKRRLIFIICDGNIVGSGNNRPTPRIVLDILGVDPKVDPEPLLFKSVGEGSKQLNYGKVYSGLYEHEGHVVPYIVVVKVGKPTETSKPGNRGKRDSQVLLLNYLNRVHFDASMSPLELEIYHQMRNVIGIDPTFYEYIFQVDADTTVEPDSLNRLISCAADDSRIIGICGETKVENERESFTTMIQVYEYYISHHLTKAFESLFGSVTCLPGCFSVYRIRTADKGRPVIISTMVIEEYAENNVDTLHKKNLFSLGEDRYLTTLMMKYFPTFKMKFTPDAIAHTVAPSRWNVLLSQRRRWINSTVHNLAELLFLPEMCGFCFFSMRFIVFIDLLGTIILPATCVYLIYLVIVVATGSAPVPIISLAMLGAVYGLQALIFILKREFMLIGWMLVYLLAFPIYSVFLPLYSFWSMDDFSWGNTRQVVGEGNNKTVVYDDEPFHDSMIPLKSFREYEANAWESASLHSEKSRPNSVLSEARTNRSRPYAQPSNRAASMYSQQDLPAGADYWRDSSPLGPAHSSRNLRNTSSQGNLRGTVSNQDLRHTASNSNMNNLNSRQRHQSMAGMSMWGPGSEMGDPVTQYPPPAPFMHPMMTGMTGISVGSQGYPNPHNPFSAPPSDYGLRPPTVFSSNPMMSNVPRNSMMSMSGLSYAGPAQNRMSSYSLATTANPFASIPLMPSEATTPTDEEVLGVLRKYLAQQDLMTVTKRQTRDALYGLFPKADLPQRSKWINENIDRILSE